MRIFLSTLAYLRLPPTSSYYPLMEFFLKMRALFKPKQAPTAPTNLYADSEFLEVVARQWKQRYEDPQPTRDQSAHLPSQARAVA